VLFFLFLLDVPSVVSTVAGDKLSFKSGVSGGGRLPRTSSAGVVGVLGSRCFCC
jgi:hypothetical protein